MYKEIIEDAQERMQGAISALQGDMATFRTGRASPSLLDRLEVVVYGVAIPLNQIASIGVPEPQQLSIKPYDANNISSIEKAIQLSDLNMTPNNDGKIIRINIPSLTEERRRALTKQVSKRAEEGKVAIRNVRRDANNDLRDMENEKMISEDDLHRAQDEIQKMTDKFSTAVDQISKNKEAEIMEI